MLKLKKKQQFLLTKIKKELETLQIKRIILQLKKSYNQQIRMLK